MQQQLRHNVNLVSICAVVDAISKEREEEAANNIHREKKKLIAISKFTHAHVYVYMRLLVCVCREQCCHVRAFLRLCFVQIAECCTNWNYLLLLCKYNRTHVLAGTTRFGLVLCMLIAADRGDTHITNTHTHSRAPEIAPAGNAAIICFCCCCCRRPSVVTNAVITSLHLCVWFCMCMFVCHAACCNFRLFDTKMYL